MLLSKTQLQQALHRVMMHVSVRRNATAGLGAEFRPAGCGLCSSRLSPQLDHPSVGPEKGHAGDGSHAATCGCYCTSSTQMGLDVLCFLSLAEISPHEKEGKDRYQNSPLSRITEYQ